MSFHIEPVGFLVQVFLCTAGGCEHRTLIHRLTTWSFSTSTARMQCRTRTSTASCLAKGVIFHGVVFNFTPSMMFYFIWMCPVLLLHQCSACFKHCWETCFLYEEMWGGSKASKLTMWPSMHCSIPNVTFVYYSMVLFSNCSYLYFPPFQCTIFHQTKVLLAGKEPFREPDWGHYFVPWH